MAAAESAVGPVADTCPPTHASKAYLQAGVNRFTSFAAMQAQIEQQEEPPRQAHEQGDSQTVPEELVSGYRSKMESLQKRRKRVPLSAGESYETWLKNNSEALEPLREFFRLHEMDAAWAIAELYKNGYWGKKLMTGHAQGKAVRIGVGEPAVDGVSTVFPWDEALNVWSAAFESEKLPHSPIDIVRRWPSLLCKTPDCLPGTVAVLRAAIPDEEALNETIAMFPRVLVQSPVKLQHRVLALQMACGMDLSRVLPKNPQLFYRNLDAIMANIRHLREHSWTLEHFESLIDYRPNILSMHPEMVKKNTQSSLEALAMILPTGADPSLVLRAKPQLILISAAHIDERWNILKSMTSQVPEWQAELDEAIQDVMDAGSAANVDRRQAPEIPNDEGGEEDMDWDQGEWGATTLGAALWSHPKRYERMQYLLETSEVGTDEDARGDHVPSFVDVLTVHLHRFSHRYKGFNEWVEMRN
jgi:hypothetical protein